MSYFKKGFTIVQNLYRLTLVTQSFHPSGTMKMSVRKQKYAGLIWQRYKVS